MDDRLAIDDSASPYEGGDRSVRRRPRRRADALARRMWILVIALGLSVIAVVLLVMGLRDRSADSADSGSDHTESVMAPIYSFVSPDVPCCRMERSEGTSQFTVGGRWRVDWMLYSKGSNGSACSVLGRIVDAKNNGFADLPPFGSGRVGRIEYDQPGTYSIMIKYDCPEDAIAMIQLNVYGSAS